MIQTQDVLAITTRPLMDAEADCRFLESRGLEAIAQPVLDIVPLPHPPFPQAAEATILTSRHAASFIKAEAEQAGLLEKPCYVVGDATARAASYAGFQDVYIAGGDGNALQELVQSSPYRHFCWPSAHHSGFNIKTALEASDEKLVERIIVYEAKLMETLNEATIEAIKLSQGPASSCIVLVHSGRAGAHFHHLLDQHDLSAYRQHITLIVISNRAAGLCGQGWHKIHVIKSPLRSLMLMQALDLAGITCHDDNISDMPLD